MGFFEIEPNNTCQTGTAFSPISGVGGGQLSGATDVDHFRIVVPDLAVMTLTISPATTNYDGSSLQAWISAEAGSDLARRILGSDSQPKLLRAIVQPGTHCVRFEARPGYQVMTKEYRLQASLDSSAVAIAGLEHEPNNSFAQANPLPTDGFPVAAQLMQDADLDIFSIETSSRTDVEVLVDVESRSYDGTAAQAWLIDATGNILSWRKLSSDQAAARNLMARRPHGGTIYLVVERIPGILLLERYVSVAAFVSTSTGLLETEPNDVPWADFLIGPGVLLGQLTTTSDVDEYSVALSPGVVQFEVSFENQTYDGSSLRFELYNGASQLLASRDIGSDAASTTINVGIAAEGLHRMVIKPRPGYIVTHKHYAVSIPVGPFVFRDGFD